MAVKQLLEHTQYQQQKFVNEIAILRSCRNENIVCFLGKKARQLVAGTVLKDISCSSVDVSDSGAVNLTSLSSKGRYVPLSSRCHDAASIHVPHHGVCTSWEPVQGHPAR